MRKFLSLLLIALLTFPQLAFAWGQQGHRIVASVAENHLDQTTLVMVQSLLGNNHLYSVAAWADEIRKDRRETAPWHYADIPLGQGYLASRDCPSNTSCIVDKLNQYVRTLTDRNASREQRAEALKFVIHFAGDIHQPMHAVGDARGGNGIHVTFFGSDRCGRFGCELHGLWDSAMIEHTGMNREAYTQHLEDLIRTQSLAKLSGGTPEAWINDSHRLAEAAWVKSGTNIDQRYYEQQINVTDRQLALAGLRLAKLLNDTLGRKTPGDFRATAASPQLQEAIKVWVNTRSGVYHCPGSPTYGKTNAGAYMDESQASHAGYRPAHGEPCSQSAAPAQPEPRLTLLDRFRLFLCRYLPCRR